MPFYNLFLLKNEILKFGQKAEVFISHFVKFGQKVEAGKSIPHSKSIEFSFKKN